MGSDDNDYDALRSEIAAAHGLPASAARFLAGSTLGDLEASARDLAAVTARTLTPNPATCSPTSSPSAAQPKTLAAPRSPAPSSPRRSNATPRQDATNTATTAARAAPPVATADPRRLAQRGAPHPQRRHRPPPLKAPLGEQRMRGYLPPMSLRKPPA